MKRFFGYDCYRDGDKPWKFWWQGYGKWEDFQRTKSSAQLPASEPVTVGSLIRSVRGK